MLLFHEQPLRVFTPPKPIARKSGSVLALVTCHRTGCQLVRVAIHLQLETALPSGSQDNYSEMDVTCLDLSPFYLAKARENMGYWRRMRAPASQKDTTDSFVQACSTLLPETLASQ